MDCPWYLGFEATEECIKTCTITEENRDNSICPESASEYDDLDISCQSCPFAKYCPCGYSAGNAACLTIRERYAEAMTTRSDALYDKAQKEAIETCPQIKNVGKRS